MKISDNVHCLKIKFKIGENIERFVNMYIIEGEKLYLIDCGVKGCSLLLKNYLNDIGRNIKEVKAVILTHAHPDHIGGVYELRKETDFELYCPREERAWVENIDKQFIERPIPDFYNIIGGSVAVDREIYDEKVIKLENGITLKAIATPGHSKGSYSFYYEEENSIFTGDVLPTAENINMPIYISGEDSIKSIRRLSNIKNIKYIFSAWDEPRKDDEVYKIFATAEKLLIDIENSVRKLYSDEEKESIVQFLKNVFEDCGIKNGIILPLTIKSIESNIKEI